MPVPPQVWENATPVFGIRYPKPTAPARYLPDAFDHIGVDLESALLADAATPAGLVYVTGTEAERAAAVPARDTIFIVTDMPNDPQYIGTGERWIRLHDASAVPVIETVEFRPDGSVLNVPVAGLAIPYLGPSWGTAGLVTLSADGTKFTLTKPGLWCVETKTGGGGLTGDTSILNLRVNDVLDPQSIYYEGGNGAGAPTITSAEYHDWPIGTVVEIVISGNIVQQVYHWSWVRFTYKGTVKE